MVWDLLTIAHCFSARLYGLRNDRKKLKAAFGRGRPELIFGHTLALDPTPDQECHLRRARSTARHA
jgi:hypothetical protein